MSALNPHQQELLAAFLAGRLTVNAAEAWSTLQEQLRHGVLKAAPECPTRIVVEHYRLNPTVWKEIFSYHWNHARKSWKSLELSGGSYTPPSLVSMANALTAAGVSEGDLEHLTICVADFKHDKATIKALIRLCAKAKHVVLDCPSFFVPNVGITDWEFLLSWWISLGSRRPSLDLQVLLSKTPKIDYFDQLCNVFSRLLVSMGQQSQHTQQQQPRQQSSPLLLSKLSIIDQREVIRFEFLPEIIMHFALGTTLCWVFDNPQAKLPTVNNMVLSQSRKAVLRNTTLRRLEFCGHVLPAFAPVLEHVYLDAMGSKVPKLSSPTLQAPSLNRIQHVQIVGAYLSEMVIQRFPDLRGLKSVKCTWFPGIVDMVARVLGLFTVDDFVRLSSPVAIYFHTEFGPDAAQQLTDKKQVQGLFRLTYLLGKVNGNVSNPHKLLVQIYSYDAQRYPAVAAAVQRLTKAQVELWCEEGWGFHEILDKTAHIKEEAARVSASHLRGAVQRSGRGGRGGGGRAGRGRGRTGRGTYRDDRRPRLEQIRARHRAAESRLVRNSRHATTSTHSLSSRRPPYPGNPNSTRPPPPSGPRSLAANMTDQVRDEIARTNLLKEQFRLYKEMKENGMTNEEIRLVEPSLARFCRDAAPVGNTNNSALASSRPNGTSPESIAAALSILHATQSVLPTAAPDSVAVILPERNPYEQISQSDLPDDDTVARANKRQDAPGDNYQIEDNHKFDRDTIERKKETPHAIMDQNSPSRGKAVQPDSNLSESRPIRRSLSNTQPTPDTQATSENSTRNFDEHVYNGDASASSKKSLSHRGPLTESPNISPGALQEEPNDRSQRSYNDDINYGQSRSSSVDNDIDEASSNSDSERQRSSSFSHIDNKTGFSAEYQFADDMDHDNSEGSRSTSRRDNEYSFSGRDSFVDEGQSDSEGTSERGDDVAWDGCQFGGKTQVYGGDSSESRSSTSQEGQDSPNQYNVGLDQSRNGETAYPLDEQTVDNGSDSGESGSSPIQKDQGDEAFDHSGNGETNTSIDPGKGSTEGFRSEGQDLFVGENGGEVSDPSKQSHQRDSKKKSFLDDSDSDGSDSSGDSDHCNKQEIFEAVDPPASNKKKVGDQSKPSIRHESNEKSFLDDSYSDGSDDSSDSRHVNKQEIFEGVDPSNCRNADVAGEQARRSNRYGDGDQEGGSDLADEDSGNDDGENSSNHVPSLVNTDGVGEKGSHDTAHDYDSQEGISNTAENKVALKNDSESNSDPDLRIDNEKELFWGADPFDLSKTNAIEEHEVDSQSGLPENTEYNGAACTDGSEGNSDHDSNLDNQQEIFWGADPFDLNKTETHDEESHVGFSDSPDNEGHGSIYGSERNSDRDTKQEIFWGADPFETSRDEEHGQDTGSTQLKDDDDFNFDSDLFEKQIPGGQSTAGSQSSGSSDYSDDVGPKVTKRNNSDEEDDSQWDGDHEGDEEDDSQWDGDHEGDEEDDSQWDGDHEGDKEDDSQWDGDHEGDEEDDSQWDGDHEGDEEDDSQSDRDQETDEEDGSQSDGDQEGDDGSDFSDYEEGTNSAHRDQDAYEDESDYSDGDNSENSLSSEQRRVQEEYLLRVERMVTQVTPDEIGNVGVMLREFVGREEELIHALREMGADDGQSQSSSYNDTSEELSDYSGQETDDIVKVVNANARPMQPPSQSKVCIGRGSDFFVEASAEEGNVDTSDTVAQPSVRQSLYVNESPLDVYNDLSESHEVGAQMTAESSNRNQDEHSEDESDDFFDDEIVGHEASEEHDKVSVSFEDETIGSEGDEVNELDHIPSMNANIGEALRPHDTSDSEDEHDEEPRSRIDQKEDMSSESEQDEESFHEEHGDENSDESSDGSISSAQRRRQQKYRAEVESLVALVVPDELDKVDDMMDQFVGREEELIDFLKRLDEDEESSNDDADSSFADTSFVADQYTESARLDEQSDDLDNRSATKHETIVLISEQTYESPEVSDSSEESSKGETEHEQVGRISQKSKDGKEVDQGNDASSIPENESDESYDSLSSEQRRVQEMYRPEVEGLVALVLPKEIDNVDVMMADFVGREDELILALKNMAETTGEDSTDGREEDITSSGDSPQTIQHCCYSSNEEGDLPIDTADHKRQAPDVYNGEDEVDRYRESYKVDISNIAQSEALPSRVDDERIRGPSPTQGNNLEGVVVQNTRDAESYPDQDFANDKSMRKADPFIMQQGHPPDENSCDDETSMRSSRTSDMDKVDFKSKENLDAIKGSWNSADGQSSSESDYLSRNDADVDEMEPSARDDNITFGYEESFSSHLVGGDESESDGLSVKIGMSAEINCTTEPHFENNQNDIIFGAGAFEIGTEESGCDDFASHEKDHSLKSNSSEEFKEGAGSMYESSAPLTHEKVNPYAQHSSSFDDSSASVEDAESVRFDDTQPPKPAIMTNSASKGGDSLRGEVDLHNIHLTENSAFVDSSEADKKRSSHSSSIDDDGEGPAEHDFALRCNTDEPSLDNTLNSPSALCNSHDGIPGSIENNLCDGALGSVQESASLLDRDRSAEREEQGTGQILEDSPDDVSGDSVSNGGIGASITEPFQVEGRRPAAFETGSSSNTDDSQDSGSHIPRELESGTKETEDFVPCVSGGHPSVAAGEVENHPNVETKVFVGLEFLRSHGNDDNMSSSSRRSPLSSEDVKLIVNESSQSSSDRYGTLVDRSEKNSDGDQGFSGSDDGGDDTEMLCETLRKNNVARLSDHNEGDEDSRRFSSGGGLSEQSSVVCPRENDVDTFGDGIRREHKFDSKSDESGSEGNSDHNDDDPDDIRSQSRRNSIAEWNIGSFPSEHSLSTTGNLDGDKKDSVSVSENGEMGSQSSSLASDNSFAEASTSPLSNEEDDRTTHDNLADPIATIPPVGRMGGNTETEYQSSIESDQDMKVDSTVAVEENVSGRSLDSNELEWDADEFRDDADSSEDNGSDVDQQSGRSEAKNHRGNDDSNSGHTGTLTDNIQIESSQQSGMSDDCTGDEESSSGHSATLTDIGRIESSQKANSSGGEESDGLSASASDDSGSFDESIFPDEGLGSKASWGSDGDHDSSAEESDGLSASSSNKSTYSADLFSTTRDSNEESGRGSKQQSDDSEEEIAEESVASQKGEEPIAGQNDGPDGAQYGAPTESADSEVQESQSNEMPAYPEGVESNQGTDSSGEASREEIQESQSSQKSESSDEEPDRMFVHERVESLSSNSDNSGHLDRGTDLSKSGSSEEGSECPSSEKPENTNEECNRVFVDEGDEHISSHSYSSDHPEQDADSSDSSEKVDSEEDQQNSIDVIFTGAIFDDTVKSISSQSRGSNELDPEEEQKSRKSDKSDSKEFKRPNDEESKRISTNWSSFEEIQRGDVLCRDSNRPDEDPEIARRGHIFDNGEDGCFSEYNNEITEEARRRHSSQVPGQPRDGHAGLAEEDGTLGDDSAENGHTLYHDESSSTEKSEQESCEETKRCQSNDPPDSLENEDSRRNLDSEHLFSDLALDAIRLDGKTETADRDDHSNISSNDETLDGEATNHYVEDQPDGIHTTEAEEETSGSASNPESNGYDGLGNDQLADESDHNGFSGSESNRSAMSASFQQKNVTEPAYSRREDVPQHGEDVSDSLSSYGSQLTDSAHDASFGEGEGRNLVQSASNSPSEKDSFDDVSESEIDRPSVGEKSQNRGSSSSDEVFSHNGFHLGWGYSSTQEEFESSDRSEIYQSKDDGVNLRPDFDVFPPKDLSDNEPSSESSILEQDGIVHDQSTPGVHSGREENASHEMGSEDQSSFGARSFDEFDAANNNGVTDSEGNSSVGSGFELNAKSTKPNDVRNSQEKDGWHKPFSHLEDSAGFEEALSPTGEIGLDENSSSPDDDSSSAQGVDDPFDNVEEEFSNDDVEFITASDSDSLASSCEHEDDVLAHGSSKGECEVIERGSSPAFAGGDEVVTYTANENCDNSVKGISDGIVDFDGGDDSFDKKSRERAVPTPTKTSFLHDSDSGDSDRKSDTDDTKLPESTPLPFAKTPHKKSSLDDSHSDKDPGSEAESDSEKLAEHTSASLLSPTSSLHRMPNPEAFPDDSTAESLDRKDSESDDTEVTLDDRKPRSTTSVASVPSPSVLSTPMKRKSFLDGESFDSDSSHAKFDLEKPIEGASTSLEVNADESTGNGSNGRRSSSLHDDSEKTPSDYNNKEIELKGDDDVNGRDAVSFGEGSIRTDEGSHSGSEYSGNEDSESWDEFTRVEENRLAGHRNSEHELGSKASSFVGSAGSEKYQGSQSSLVHKDSDYSPSENSGNENSGSGDEGVGVGGDQEGDESSTEREDNYNYPEIVESEDGVEAFGNPGCDSETFDFRPSGVSLNERRQYSDVDDSGTAHDANGKDEFGSDVDLFKKRATDSKGDNRRQSGKHTDFYDEGSVPSQSRNCANSNMAGTNDELQSQSIHSLDFSKQVRHDSGDDAGVGSRSLGKPFVGSNGDEGSRQGNNNESPHDEEGESHETVIGKSSEFDGSAIFEPPDLAEIDQSSDSDNFEVLENDTDGEAGSYSNRDDVSDESMEQFDLSDQESIDRNSTEFDEKVAENEQELNEDTSEDSITSMQRRVQEKYRPQIEKLVALVVPDEIGNVDVMLREFVGREEELVTALNNVAMHSGGYVSGDDEEGKSVASKLSAEDEDISRGSLDDEDDSVSSGYESGRGSRSLCSTSENDEDASFSFSSGSVEDELAGSESY
eukprot:scaffold2917_cov191-Amphora_coffeaeformis.AAC.26